MQDSSDTEQEGCRTGRNKYTSDAGQDRHSTIRMQDRWQFRCRSGQMQDSFISFLMVVLKCLAFLCFQKKARRKCLRTLKKNGCHIAAKHVLGDPSA